MLIPTIPLWEKHRTSLRLPPSRASDQDRNCRYIGGHKSLSILFRFTHNLLSARDPGALVAEPHRLRLPQTKNSPQGLFS